MASVTTAWDTRFGLFQGLHQCAHDNSVVRDLKKKSQKAISRASYFCAEEHQRRMGAETQTGTGERDLVGLSSLFPAKDQVGTFIGYPDRDGEAANIGEEDTEVFPLLRVGSSSYYIGIADIIGERDWLREQVGTWKDTCARHVRNILNNQDDINWLTYRGGCGTNHEWSVDQHVWENGGYECVAIRKWDEWSEVWQEHHSLAAPGVVPANWWELVDLYETEVSRARAAQDRAEVERDRALAEVETQKAACRNSWAAQEERDESALAEVSRLRAEKEDLKKKVEALERDLERLEDLAECRAHKSRLAEESRMEAADACEAIQRKNSRLQEAIKVILDAGQEVYEEDE